MFWPERKTARAISGIVVSNGWGTLQVKNNRHNHSPNLFHIEFVPGGDDLVDGQPKHEVEEALCLFYPFRGVL